MNVAQFETLLSLVADQLTHEARQELFSKPKEFEDRVREVLLEKGYNGKIDFKPHPHIFPDIVLGKFGIEVKFTMNDTWRSVANSIFESTRSESVKHVYIVFGKMGGEPSVGWGRYEDCVMHVRTSHVPRFEVELFPEESLFEKMGINYDTFRELPLEDKMVHIRKYARGRLKHGERLWWLEDDPAKDHTLPIEVKLYMNLSQDEKRALRAEAALLCPQIVKPSRTKNKYTDAVMYILTYHGVLCPQARDLFSAGSVALRSNPTRGGNYTLRALQDIESEMLLAAGRLEDALFEEYWGELVERDRRIERWLQLADGYAKDWIPSEHLFKR